MTKLRHKRKLLVSAGLAVLGLAAGRDALATNHEIGLTEVGAGVNGNAAAQFIEIRMLANGQNLWGPQPGETSSRAILTFWNASGNKTGEFAFTADAPDRANRFVLIGTQAFKDLTNQPDPDIIIPPLIQAGSGRVCFETNPNNLVFIIADCIAYGTFPAASNNRDVGGSVFTFGNPLPDTLPVAGFSSIRRKEVGDMIFGFGFADTDDNQADYFLSATPTPTPSGDSLPEPSPAEVEAGRVLFSDETFGGNGRTCATCHVLALNGALPPSNIAQRFSTLATSFDPLFIAEPNMNLNTLTVNTGVSFAVGSVLTGTAGGATAKVKVRAVLSSTRFLVHGGIAPALTTGTAISDGTRTANVVSIVKGDLDQLESPQRMRTSTSPAFPQGRGLILENIDGFDKAPVFRKSPHIQNLKFSGPFGFSDDILTLEEFAVGAVKQHFPRTLARQEGIDFRLPTAEEQRLMAIFMRSLDSIPGGSFTKFNLGNFARTSAQKRGRNLFDNQGCSVCHFSPVLSGSAFQTGINNQPIDGPGGDNLPIDSNPPGGVTNRAIGAPGLFNVKNNGPFFHESSRTTVLDAVNFYISPAFQNSPEGPNFGINFDAAGAADIAAFLEGLVARDYVVLDGAVDVTREETVVDFGARFLGAGSLSRTLTVRNTSATKSVTFASTACRIAGIAGQTPGEFPAPDCSQLNGVTLAPGAQRTITVRFDPATSGTKSAILELVTGDPTGVDLRGRGLGAEVDEVFDSDEFPVPRFTHQRGVDDGFFSVFNGQLNMFECFSCVGPNGNIFTHEFELPASFTFTVDGIATASASPVDDFSVIFNFKDVNNYYYASFNEKDTNSSGADDTATNGIFKVVNGTRTQIRDFSVTTPPGDETAALHKIRIEKIASTIRVFRGSTLLGVVTDSTFTGGKAGVGSFNNSGRFDNFVIRAHVLGADFTASANPFNTSLGGTFTVTGGKLQLTNPATNNNLPNANVAVHTTAVPAGDFELFVDANATSTSSTADDVTIVFNFQNVTNYMFVNFSESNTSATNGVFRVVNSVVTQIRGFGTNLQPPGTARRISVRRTGAAIRILRDGTQVSTDVNDSTFSGGQAGVGSRDNAATFDNVFVEQKR